jgi:DNA-binding NarL/FixJ family response regulator
MHIRAMAPRVTHSPLLRAAPDNEFSIGTKRSRILIVEDDYLVGLELEHRLTEAGYEVVGIAATAEEALAIAQVERPTLTIMDIRLAGERDGIDAAAEIFRTLGIRSIFASAHSDPEIRKRGEVAQPVGWLQKPYSAESLIALIRRSAGEIPPG